MKTALAILKHRARATLNNEIGAGRIQRGTSCGLCGVVEEIEAHHPDYSFPLQVTWLCTGCHVEWHTRHPTEGKRAYRPAPRPKQPGTMETSESLKRIRSEAGLTQQEMARKLGCGLRTYIRYEAGTRVPPATTWLKAAALDHPVEASR